MEIKTVGLIGAGAVGAYFIAGMAERLGERFCLIAEGERKKRLEQEGVRINERVYRPPVREPAKAHGVDLLLVATKYYGLSDALPLIEGAVGEHTVVMSLLNGVDSEEVIAERIGKERLLYSVIRISSRRTEEGIFFDPAITQGVTFGEENGAVTERVGAVEKLFAECGIRARVPDNILEDIWKKYALNVSYNLPQAVIGVGCGAYFTGEHLAFLRDALFREVEAVGRARGVRVLETEGMEKLPKATRWSTLQDLDAKRKTEVDMFLLTLMRMAKEEGLEAPYAACIYHIIKALEDKNAGAYNF